MASHRALASIPASLSRLASPATRAALHRRQPPLSFTTPTATLRLAHSIPRPRKPSPFQQQSQQPTQPQQPQQPPTPSPPASTFPPASLPTSPSQGQSPTSRPNIASQPHYELTFTCIPCSTRSRHRVSKQGYHHGSVLIACPGCKNRHVISDHLSIFGDKGGPTTVEDLLRAKGEDVKRGVLEEDGDWEVWEDGSMTVREGWVEKADQEGKGGEELPPGATFK
ncbi:DNL zinc finger-domain-containing protein, partial [Staphylotrichum tortipilum]